jgi:hypothetical protein
MGNPIASIGQMPRPARPAKRSCDPQCRHASSLFAADPRARIRRQPGGLYGRDSKRTARKSHYRLADEPSPLIEWAEGAAHYRFAFAA